MPWYQEHEMTTGRKISLLQKILDAFYYARKGVVTAIVYFSLRFRNRKRQLGRAVFYPPQCGGFFRGVLTTEPWPIIPMKRGRGMDVQVPFAPERTAFIARCGGARCHCRGCGNRGLGPGGRTRDRRRFRHINCVPVFTVGKRWPLIQAP